MVNWAAVVGGFVVVSVAIVSGVLKLIFNKLATLDNRQYGTAQAVSRIEGAVAKLIDIRKGE